MTEKKDRIQYLIDALRVLPGVGNKSAQRLAFTLLQHERAGAQQLAAAITDALAHLRHCEQCYTLSDDAVCSTCANPRRQREDRKSTRLNSSHLKLSRMPSSA